MPSWIWILIAVVAVLAVVFVVGLVRLRSRRVSLTEEPAKTVTDQQKPAVEPPAKGGGYKAGGSISFSSGTSVAERPQQPAGPRRPPTPQTATQDVDQPSQPHPAGERTEVDGQPGVGDDAAVPRDWDRPTVIDVELPDEPVVEPEATPAEADAAPTAPAQPAGTEQEPATAEPAGPEQAAEDAAPAEPTTSAEPVLPTEPAAPAAPVATATTEPAPPAVESAIPAEFAEQTPEGEEIAPTAGRLSRLRGRLSRSQNAFGKSLLGLLGAGTLDEDSWTDVEDTLLMADLGAGAAADITERLRQEMAATGVDSSAQAKAMLRKVLVEAVDAGAPDRSIRALPHDGRPSVLLVVGVNGTGKTTTTGKLARVLVADGHTVVLGAADTFRAAAADQLATWAQRAGATVVRAEAGADPAAVAFDAVKRGIADGADAVLVDTAGRLHTKAGLMDELGKVKRVIEKLAKADEILLVLDATTGQNGLVQAKVFADVVNITGIVLTKLDGTAKGGIVVAVQRALGVPVKLVGLGEGPDDLAPFEPGAFVDALLG